MAHFAELDENNIVKGVHVVDDEVITKDGKLDEEIGIKYLRNLFGDSGVWRQTYKDLSHRKNYAGSDYTYDQARDAFIPPKVYPSWHLNEDTCRWDAPTPKPDDDKYYWWNEDNTIWVEIE